MAIDRQTAIQLQRFSTAFRDARERGANESDTVMYLIKFFEEVLGYDALKGEISKELAIKDRYCDMALKIDGAVRVLVEVKAASVKGLTAKHIEQAENYASRAGIQWVVLTNGIEWNLYHLTFSVGEGITHDLAFTANLLDELPATADALWLKLGLLARDRIRKDALEDYWAQKKVLSPASVVRVLFTEEVLRVVRRLLRKDAEAMLDIEDVFKAVRDVISKEALADAGDLGLKRTRKRRKRAAVPRDPTLADAGAALGDPSAEEDEDDSGDELEGEDEPSGVVATTPGNEGPGGNVGS